MKKCNKCKLFKHHDEFHKCSSTIDGLQATCKHCRHIARIKSYYKNIEKNKILNDLWRKNNLDKRAITQRKYISNNLDKRLAHNRSRKIHYVPVLCPICKNSFVSEKHHPDYSQPLKVVWLCSLVISKST